MSSFSTSLIRKQKSKVKKGHLYKAVVCETKKIYGRADGSKSLKKYSCVTITVKFKLLVLFVFKEIQ